MLIRDNLISERACFIIVRLSRPSGIMIQAGIPYHKRIACRWGLFGRKVDR